MSEKTIILKNLYQGDHKAKMVFYNGSMTYQMVQRLVFEVDTTPLVFPKSGGTITISITANDNWTMTVPNWLTASVLSGTGNASVTLTAASTEQSLTSEIVITCEGETKTIEATQPVARWVEIDANFDRSKPFTKVRWDISSTITAAWDANPCNGYFAESPNINVDGKTWRNCTGATYAYAGNNRFCLRSPYVFFSCHSENFSDRKIATYGTPVGNNVYEYTYPVNLYWGGFGDVTTLYNSPTGTGVWVYVEN